VALLTAGAVAVLFAEPSQSAAETTMAAQGAAEATPELAADAPILTASLDPTFPPIHKVVTKSYPALKGDALVLKSAPAPKTAVVEPAASKPVAPVDKAVTDAPDDGADAKPVEVADAAATDSLEPQDPRWARTDNPDAAFLSVIPDAAVAAGGNLPAADQSASTADDSADDTQTAAIEPDQIKPKRAKGSKADDASAQATDDTPSPPGVSGSTRPAQVNRGVTMRSRGHKGAGAITTIPKGAVVQVAGCKAWCEIVYKGRHGYIYKDFLGGGSQRAASAKSRDTTRGKPKSVYVVDAQDKPQSNGQDNAQDQTKRVQFTSPRLQ